VTVLAPDALNTTTATDDYATTLINTTIGGNVKTNDVDPEGNGTKVMVQNLTATIGTAATNPVFGKGTLTMNAAGVYSFTPIAGYSGTVDIPYTICDSGVIPQACAEATLHVVVSNPVNLPEPDINAGEIKQTIPGNVATNDKMPPGTTYSSPASNPSNPTAALPVVNANGTYTFSSPVPGVYTFKVPVCVPGSPVPCPTEPLIITVSDQTLNDNVPVANTDLSATRINTPVTIPILANDGPGNTIGTLGMPTLVSGGKPGSTTSIDPSGKLVYTPPIGYVGNDTIQYKVCETPSGKCDSAIAIITVQALDAFNSTIASDDYLKTQFNSQVSGNVKTNDKDPEGNVTKVVAQNQLPTSGSASTNPVFGKGTLVLNSAGDVTFTPVPGYYGTMDIPYTICDSGAIPQACAEATLHIVVYAPIFVPEPDINAGELNKTIPGNVATNDNVPTGSTYGNPAPNPANPSNVLPLVNPDGTYTFNTPTPGVYHFDVPVCTPGGPIPCPTEPLLITITDPIRNSNLPVANTDLSSVKINTSVTIPILANDGSGNTGGVLSSPTILSGGQPGATASIDPTGKLIYTPPTGFTGIDTVRYKVCDASNGKCDSALVIITVLPADAVNTTTAVDDYAATTALTPVSGNVRTNDVDADGNPQKVSPRTLTATSGTALSNPVFGKGILSLDSSGNYTFSPIAGFSGTVDIPYSTCDSGARPQVCAGATLHIVVSPPIVNPEPDMNAGELNKTIPGDVATNDKVPAGTTYGTPATNPLNPSSAMPVVNPDGTYTFTTPTTGVYTFNIPVCVPAGAIPCPTQPLVITITDPTKNNNIPVANPDLASVKVNTPVIIPILANDGPGNAGGTLSIPTIIAGGHPGSTASIDPSGKLTYTPPTGFTGLDTIRYKVCETPSGQCDSAVAIITVLPVDAINTTSASDDYITTPAATPVAGNVKTNDSDPEGNVQKLSPQILTASSGTAANNPVFGKGTLTLDAAGNFAFTPVQGFSGTVDIPYTTCDSGVIPQACAEATLHIVVSNPVIAPLPDMNAGDVNNVIPGDVATNDKVPVGTTYGKPVGDATNPNSALPVFNLDGTYTFTTPVPGVYTFAVPVCAPIPLVNCIDAPLKITIADPTRNSNIPVANTDLGSTRLNAPVTIAILANDGPGNTGGTLGAPVIIGSGKPGSTAIIDPSGKLIYTPPTGFTGMDTVKYRVCETPSGKCDSAIAVISVLPSDLVNTTSATDDYVRTNANVAVSGNVKINDTDPEGNSQTVSVQNLTATSGSVATNPVFGKGTFSLDSAGNYTFTPVPGFFGTVDIAYTTCDNGGIPQACAEASLHVVVTAPVVAPLPDLNAGDINVPIPGNVATNDKVPSGTNYSNPAPNPSNPSASVPVVNTDGTYTFITSTPGVYNFNIPVCVPGGTIPCPTEPLVITITDPAKGNNVPVANTDLATVHINTPVTIPILANDGPGNTGGSLGTPTIIGAGKPGSTASIDPSGHLIYTPPSGFTGTDTIRYKVCESPSGKCDSAIAIVTVIPADAVNTTLAADDYISTVGSTTASGNVKINDSDPEGNPQKVGIMNLNATAGTASSNPVFGKGTLTLDNAGNYTFTALPGFAGTVDIPYTTCDSGAIPQACAGASLHIVVKAPENTLFQDVNDGIINKPIPGNVSTNDRVPSGTTYGNPASNPTNPSIAAPIVNTDGSYTFSTAVPGIYTFNVPVCVPGGTLPCPGLPLVITVVDPTVYNNPPVANTDLSVTPFNTPVIIPILANDGPGNTGDTLNSPVIIGGGKPGAVISIDPSGQLRYTPPSGYIGQDTLKYQVCARPSGTCDTASVVITVQAPNAVNTTLAADDYISTTNRGTAQGNVLTNDVDPEGNKQKVTPQSYTATSGTAATNPVFGKGSLSLDSAGKYLFLPDTGFTGTVNIPYMVCDSGAIPQVCAQATLHVSVWPMNTLCVNLRVYLEGALINNANAVSVDGRPLMRDNLRSGIFPQALGVNFIPYQDPYEVPTAHVNVASRYTKLPPQTTHQEYQQVTDSNVFKVTGQNAIVDWAFIELRSKANGMTVMATRAALLQRDGDIVDVNGAGCVAFPGIPVDSYYVAIRHRSHLGIMTKYAQSSSNLFNLVDLSLISTPIFDFGTSLPPFDYSGLATNNTVKSGYRAMWQGDFNADRKIKYDNPSGDDNFLLFNVLNDLNNPNSFTNFNNSFGYYQGDFNMDSKNKYDNPNGDDNLLLFQMLNYPLNTNHFTNYNFFLQQLP